MTQERLEQIVEKRAAEIVVDFNNLRDEKTSEFDGVLYFAVEDGHDDIAFSSTVRSALVYYDLPYLNFEVVTAYIRAVNTKSNRLVVVSVIDKDNNKSTAVLRFIEAVYVRENLSNLKKAVMEIKTAMTAAATWTSEDGKKYHDKTVELYEKTHETIESMIDFFGSYRKTDEWKELTASYDKIMRVTNDM